ncbi:MAG: hypothetical protein ACTSWK_01960 [Promethearchaeota archaeon]
MDTSPEYIKMCWNHWIQDLWKPTEGDWYFHTQSISAIAIIANTYKAIKGVTHGINQYGENIYIKRSIWLPLPFQDPLQDMVFNKFKKITGTKNNSFIYDEMITSFYNFCFNGKTTQQWPWNNYTTSMEQFWINFAMYELFNREWDGKEWTIITHLRKE